MTATRNEIGSTTKIFWDAINPGSIVTTYRPQVHGTAEGACDTLRLRIDGSDGSWILLDGDREIKRGSANPPDFRRAVELRTIANVCARTARGSVGRFDALKAAGVRHPEAH